MTSSATATAAAAGAAGMAAGGRARFAYTALDRGGRTRTGLVEADGRAEAAARLRAQDLHLLDLAPAAAGMAAPPAPGSAPAATRAAGPHAPSRVRRADAEQFFRLLARMLGAGVPLERALGIVAAAQDDAAGRLARAMRADLRGGTTPSRAAAAHPGVFDPSLVALIRAGEASGQMAGAFEEIEKLVVRRNHLRQQMVSAAVYPAILVAVAVLCVLTILLFVIPKFEGLVSDAAVSLPLAARAVFGASRFVQALGPVLAGLVALAAAALALRARSGRLGGDALALAAGLPKVGAILRLAGVARLCRVLGTLLARNVALLAAVETAAGAESGPLGEGLGQVRAQLRDGATLGAALETTGLFPATVLQLVRIGEETGTVGAMLGRAAELLEEEVERAAKQFLILFQPFILLVLGLIIGALLYGLFSAILSINQSIL